jgi:hypothetical protein
MPARDELIWWIDTAGVLHAACATACRPPSDNAAQGIVDPVRHAGTITHIRGQHARPGAVPRELVDALDRRFPQTRWWIFDRAAATQPVAIPAN